MVEISHCLCLVDSRSVLLSGQMISPPSFSSFLGPRAR